jgi:hypothetical protein
MPILYRHNNQDGGDDDDNDDDVDDGDDDDVDNDFIPTELLKNGQTASLEENQVFMVICI